MSEALYSIGTWDTDLQAYSPQPGVPKSINITLHELRAAMKLLRRMGYSCHRFRDADGTHDDNDWMVLIERTDGKSESEIRESWRR